jgi:hypothetical protein
VVSLPRAASSDLDCDAGCNFASIYSEFNNSPTEGRKPIEFVRWVKPTDPTRGAPTRRLCPQIREGISRSFLAADHAQRQVNNIPCIRP